MMSDAAAPRGPTPGKVGIDALARHPFRIDVRSPSEFAEDHLPGAVNWPVLDDAQRAEIGTLHAQVSAFVAKQRGAAIVARNIADILDTHCRDFPRDWAPLVYCWRGGKRSGSLAHILKEIGWRAVQLDGGYRTYRRHVVERLAVLPHRFRFVVICGLTGSGKSRLLGALADAGEQVLDLEGHAKHRGSLLGDLPHDPQPTQKSFDSAVLAALEALDPLRPVFVESESRKIGTVQVADGVLAAMRDARCVRVVTPQPLRVALLKEEYAHFLADPAALNARLAHLVPLHGRKTVERWAAAALAGDFDPLVTELLVAHYDPTYSRSIVRNFPASAHAIEVAPAGITQSAFAALAREVAAAATPAAATAA
ncbi:MAG: tRNA 2-selenouridine(34) synthase MnmH [Burkholderiales bacterium]